MPLDPRGRVAIIGAGEAGAVSGAQLAMLCLSAGYQTTLEDVLPGNLRRAAATIDPSISAGIRYAQTIEEAVRDADFILDTVPDELESKLEILSLLDRMAPPSALFATPIETLSIADLASCTYRPGQCFALRFLSIAPLQVALTHVPECTLDAIERMQRFLRALRAEVTTEADTRALP